MKNKSQDDSVFKKKAWELFKLEIFKEDSDDDIKMYVFGIYV